MSDIEKHLRWLRDVSGRTNIEAAMAIEEVLCHAQDAEAEVERLKGVLGPVLEIAERNEPGSATWAARKALEGEI